MGMDVRGEGNVTRLSVPYESADNSAKVEFIVHPDKYIVSAGNTKMFSQAYHAKITRILDMLMADLRGEDVLKFLPNNMNKVDEPNKINESEAKLRGYIKNRLKEKVGLVKPKLNENKKSAKLMKLDALIDAQYNLHESMKKTKK